MLRHQASGTTTTLARDTTFVPSYFCGLSVAALAGESLLVMSFIYQHNSSEPRSPTHPLLNERAQLPLETA